MANKPAKPFLFCGFWGYAPNKKAVAKKFFLCCSFKFEIFITFVVSYLAIYTQLHVFYILLIIGLIKF